MSAALLGILSALSFGAADFMARFSTRAHNPVASYGAVLLVGAIATSLVVLVSGQSLVWSPLGVGFAMLHGLASAVMAVLLYWGLARGPISVVAPIVASHPAFVLMVMVALGSRPEVAQWVAMAVVLAGGILIAWMAEEDEPGDARDPSHLRTTLRIAVAACLIYVALVLTGQQAVPEIGALQTTWIGRLTGLAAIVAVAAASRQSLAIRPRWMPFLLVQGFADMLGYATLTAGGGTAHPEITAVISAGFSVVTVLLAWAILKERIGPLQWLAIAMIAGGSAVLAGG
ncbi:MAG: EamA family transporter [Hyphomicrobiaceae bacterium]